MIEGTWINRRINKALTIAGSDSGGGAGIQADLKTFAALGVYGSSVITAITAQNTRGIRASSRVAPELVAGQLETVLGDIGADAIKIGMLHDEEIIEVVAAALEAYRVPPRVVDPVMIATSGSRLLCPSGERALRDRLLPLVNFVTPNIDEASVLCGFPINYQADIARAAYRLREMGPRHVVITGAIRGSECVDYYYDGQELRELSMPLLDTPHTHGTGCTFSSALAAYLARGADPWTAVNMAKSYVWSGIFYAYRVGSGSGPLNHLAGFFPGQLDNPEILKMRAGACQDWGHIPELPAPLLNVIIGGPLCRGMDYADLTRKMIASGARLIQLREKEGETRHLVETARRMKEVCHAQGALFVVNDRVDVAVASGADGVHIGQDDLAPRMARALLGPEKILGVSVANLAEAEAAVADGATYLGVGPVYPTDSKDCGVPAGGPAMVAEIAARVPIPVVAIGGITPENAPPLMEAGAAGIAVISAVLANPDPQRVVREFMQLLEMFQGRRRD